MIAPKQGESPSGPPPETPLSGCVLSVFRMMVGPGLLCVIAATIAVNKVALGSAWDVAFLIVLAATVAATLLAPATPVQAPLNPGEVAPMSRSKYVAMILATALTIFIMAHFVVPKVF